MGIEYEEQQKKSKNRSTCNGISCRAGSITGANEFQVQALSAIAYFSNCLLIARYEANGLTGKSVRVTWCEACELTYFCNPTGNGVVVDFACYKCG